MKLATVGKICKPFRGTSSPTIANLNPTDTSLVTDGQNNEIHRQDNPISQCDCSVAERKCGHDVPRAATGATARAGSGSSTRGQRKRDDGTRPDSSPGSTRSTAADLLRNTMVMCIFPTGSLYKSQKSYLKHDSSHGFSEKSNSSWVRN